MARIHASAPTPVAPFPVPPVYAPASTALPAPMLRFPLSIFTAAFVRPWPCGVGYSFACFSRYTCFAPYPRCVLAHVTFVSPCPCGTGCTYAPSASRLCPRRLCMPLPLWHWLQLYMLRPLSPPRPHPRRLCVPLPCGTGCTGCTHAPFIPTVRFPAPLLYAPAPAALTTNKHVWASTPAAFLPTLLFFVPATAALATPVLCFPPLCVCRATPVCPCPCCTGYTYAPSTPAARLPAPPCMPMPLWHWLQL